MTISTQKLSILFIMSLLVTACGGGGGGGGDAATPTNDTASTTDASSTNITPVVEPRIVVTPTPAIALATVTMQELVATEAFSFTTKQSIQVSVSLAEYEKDRAYISVYGDYQQLQSGRFFPDATSRTVAGNLQQGVFESSFLSLNQQPTFLVEVWFYDGQDALQKEITLVNNKLLW